MGFFKTFNAVADNNMKTFLLVQIAESRLAKQVFADKGTRALFRVETQKLSATDRAKMIAEALECIIEFIDPLTTQLEYETKVRQVMCRIYRAELGNVIKGVFDGFMNPINKITQGGQHQLITVPSELDMIASCDFETSVRVWHEIGGNLIALENSSNWRTVGKVLNLKNSLSPTDFDMGPKGIKYGVNLNVAVLWSREFGLTTNTECLPTNPDSVLHNKINRVSWKTFCDDWLNRDTFTNEIGITAKAALKMCFEPFTAINIFTRRDAYKYDRKGHLKADFFMPDDLLVSPATIDGVEAITKTAIDNAEMRAVLNEINLHRLHDEVLACECNGIIECFDFTTATKSASGKEFIKFNRVGGIGVTGDSGKGMGKAVNVITGKGLHSKDNSSVLSTVFRGRVGSEGYIVTTLVCRTPVPPGPFGSKKFYKNHLITEGIQMLKLVEEYEYHHLALQIPDKDIPANLVLGKQLKDYIIKGSDIQIILYYNILFLLDSKIICFRRIPFERF